MPGVTVEAGVDVISIRTRGASCMVSRNGKERDGPALCESPRAHRQIIVQRREREVTESFELLRQRQDRIRGERGRRFASLSRYGYVPVVHTKTSRLEPEGKQASEGREDESLFCGSPVLVFEAVFFAVGIFLHDGWKQSGDGPSFSSLGAPIGRISYTYHG